MEGDTYSPEERAELLKKLQEVYGPLIDLAIPSLRVAEDILNKGENLQLQFIRNWNLCPRNMVSLTNIEPCTMTAWTHDHQLSIYYIWRSHQQMLMYIFQNLVSINLMPSVTSPMPNSINLIYCNPDTRQTVMIAKYPATHTPYPAGCALYSRFPNFIT